MKQSKLWSVIIVVIIGFNAITIAGLNETVWTDHWTYELADRLRLKGVSPFNDLYTQTRPWTRGEFARCLVKFDSTAHGDMNLSPVDRRHLELLRQEFRVEMEQLFAPESDETFRFGIETDIAVKFCDGDIRLRPRIRSFGGLSYGSLLTLQMQPVFDLNAKDDSLYIGENWRGITGVYVEQAYFLLEKGAFRLQFGRDYLVWGAGRFGKLMLSDHSRSFDMIVLSYDIDFAKVSFMTSALDPYPNVTYPRSKRYLAVQRFDFKLCRNRIEFAICHSTLYGGPERSMELQYLNPLLIFQAVSFNNELWVEANTLLSFDLSLYPTDGLMLWGSLLIDDYQVDRETVHDLEPNEIAYTIGGWWMEPFQYRNLEMEIGYTRVANRTYNVLQEDQKFVHRKKSIGYYLGNNCDRSDAKLRWWVRPEFRMEGLMYYMRRGEEALLAPFDTSFDSTTVEEGYSEPFPFGITEKTLGVGLNAQWYISGILRAEGTLIYEWTTNRYNVENDDYNALRAELQLHIAFDSHPSKERIKKWLGN